MVRSVHHLTNRENPNQDNQKRAGGRYDPWLKAWLTVDVKNGLAQRPLDRIAKTGQGAGLPCSGRDDVEP